MWIIANAFQKEGGISPRINQDSVKGAAVQKKKTSDTAYREPLLDRIIPPRTITLPNDKIKCFFIFWTFGLYNTLGFSALDTWLYIHWVACFGCLKSSQLRRMSAADIKVRK